jgi:leucyl aminopeptidase (aminopeptidase T)
LTRHGEEPPEEVAAAVLGADAAALVTKFSLSHTPHVWQPRRGARASRRCPRSASRCFARTLPIDYARLESVGRALAAQLTAADRCRIVAPSGTDVELVLRGRTGFSDDGDLRAPGAFGNLPAGRDTSRRSRPKATGRSRSICPSPPSGRSRSRSVSKSRAGAQSARRAAGRPRR